MNLLLLQTGVSDLLGWVSLEISGIFQLAAQPLPGHLNQGDSVNILLILPLSDCSWGEEAT